MLTSIYKYSPVYLQNVFVSLYGMYWKHRRFGGKFHHYLKEFKERENYSVRQWKEFQTIALRKLLIHAFLNVPFYKEKYSSLGFTLQDIENFELSMLPDLPYLEKEELRKFGETTLLATNKKPGKFYTSSGSTGTPTKIYFSKVTHQKWSALYEARVRNWAGVNYLQARAMIGGRRVLPTAKMKTPYYRYNLAEKQAYFSAYHLSEETINDYLIGFFKTKPTYLVGYTVSIYLLATYINQYGLKAPKLNAVLTSSEKLTQSMRTAIEQAFQCKVFDAYSGVEACGLISENNKGELLFSPDSGIMELVDVNGKQVSNGTEGEVIATGFLNYDQPLIRYRIGDRITLCKNQKLSMPLVQEINGREEDVLIGKDGQKMVRFHGIFIGIKHLRMAQVIQHSFDLIELKLVVEANYTKKNEELMIQRVQSQLGNIKVKFTYVNKIEQTKNGKFKAVISLLNEE